MSSMAKVARAAMKSKARKMADGEPKAKVDASSWSPPEMMNTGAKTGMRPLSRRAFRKGGKVVEKCEGGAAKMRMDRKQRKTGGRSLVTDLINRNDKKANLAREGGNAHVGGYKRGGDVAQDKKLIKKALAQHDKHMHGGKHEDIKLKKGGRTHKQYGGSDGEYGGSDGKYGNIDELMRAKGIGPYAPRRETAPRDDDMTNPFTGKPRTGRKKGGRTHKQYGGSDGDVLASAVNKADAQNSPYRAHRLRGQDFDTPERKEYDARMDRMGRASYAAESHDLDAQNAINRANRKRGGKTSGTYFGGTRPTGGRMPRKAGGRAKGKTNIVISINPPRPDQQPAIAPKMPTPAPIPVPPVAPPPAMGAGAPPPMPPMPPGAGGPGAPGAMPPGMPPLPRKSGGRAYRSYKDMDAGAMGGKGRLEKTAIQKHKR